MAKLFERIWNLSPASVTRAIRRRMERFGNRNVWRVVKAGTLRGVELFMPAMGTGMWAEMMEGRFDAFLYDELLKYKNLSGATCWDIGAHIGYHSLGFAALGAQVLAIEPNRYNAERLQMHLDRNRNLSQRVKLLCMAISDRDGEMAFVQSRDLDGCSSGSHLERALPPLASAFYSNFERSRIPTTRIDTLVETKQELVPDVIKIDVEGAELLVLQGGRNFFSRHKPMLLIEVHHICLMFHIQKFLLEQGYELKLLNEESASPSRCFVLAW